MPTIKSHNIKIKFEYIALYPGIKRIDKSVAKENLFLFKEILNKYEIPFQLAFGSVLGAVRDKDFISHDEDIDLSLLSEDWNNFLSIYPELKSYGFEICRYDRRDLLSIMRKGEYIDLYFFHPYRNGLRICSGGVCFDKFVTQSVTYPFLDNNFNIPADFIDYLRFYYGENWQTPIQYNNYNQKNHRIRLYKLKEYIKNKLPNYIYHKLAERSEKKRTERTFKMVETFQFSEK